VFKTYQLLLLLCSANLACAQTDVFTEKNVDEDNSDKSPWKTEIELGYQQHSGNTDSQSVSSRLLAEYTEGRHRTTGSLKFYRLEKDGEEAKRRFIYALQSDYKIKPKIYLYTNFKGMDTHYSAYYKDYTLSSGLGYIFSHSEKLSIEAELGPGYRYQEPNLDQIGDTDVVFPEIIQEAIIRQGLTLSWKILKNVTFESNITDVIGNTSSVITEDSGIILDVTHDIALKLDHSLIYHAKVPNNNLSKSDSVSSLNLIFLF
jgi:putative salt-induced outer membrane protein